MNKKILYTAIISTVGQVVLLISGYLNLVNFRHYFLLLLFIFYCLAIPYALYWLIKTLRVTPLKIRILNVVCLLFTFPVVIVTVVILREYNRVLEPVEIDPGDLHIYNSSGNELPLDTLPKLMNPHDSISRIELSEEAKMRVD